MEIYKDHLRNTFMSTKEQNRRTKHLLHRAQCVFVFQILEEKKKRMKPDLLIPHIQQLDFKFGEQMSEIT